MFFFGSGPERRGGVGPRRAGRRALGDGEVALDETHELAHVQALGVFCRGLQARDKSANFHDFFGFVFKKFEWRRDVIWRLETLLTSAGLGCQVSCVPLRPHEVRGRAL